MVPDWSSEFQKSYHLLAQTPMIHFQSQEENACLRATEVKPKLDRFIFARRGEEIPPEWRNPLQPTALQYKMQIVPQEAHSEASMITADDCKAFYFGNMGVKDKKKKKKTVFRNCELKITCFVPELLDCIDELIGDFFVLHNFGARQSKGFGGFLVEEKNTDSAEVIRIHCKHYFYAKLPAPNPAISEKGKFYSALNHAAAIYTFLKNGTNQTRGKYWLKDRYIKGFVMRDYLPDATGNDKAFIKSEILPVDGDEFDYTRFTFIRAILGLADHYEFRDDMRNAGYDEEENLKPLSAYFKNYNGTRIGEGGTLFFHEDAVKKGKGIKRFRSPFLIKIYDNVVYFILEDSYKLMLNQVFLFAKKEKELEIDKDKPLKQELARLGSLPYISTPSSFNPDEFICRFVRYFKENRGRLRAFEEKNPNRMSNPLCYSADLILKKGGSVNG